MLDPPVAPTPWPTPWRAGPGKTWTGIAAAVAVHGALIGTVYGLDITIIGGHGPSSASADDEDKPPVELAPSCTGDALLALGARTSLCLAPWHDDIGECADDAQMSLYLDLSACIARNEPMPTSIGLVAQKSLDKIKSIDPEPLLEAMDKPKPPQPPPDKVPELKPATPPPPPPPQPPAARAVQVVETVKPDTEQSPTNARFVSEYDTDVKHETVNRGARNEPMVAKAKPEDATPKPKTSEDPTVKQLSPDRPPGRDVRAPDAPGVLSMRNPGAPHPAETAQDAKTRGSETAAHGVATSDGLAPKHGDGSTDEEKRERADQPAGGGGAGGGAPNIPNLNPSREQLERALGGGSVDHVEDIDSGDETALSSKKWIYASFFNRLKRQVAQNWDPGSVWRHSGGGRGGSSKVTEVRVSLNKTGELVRIVVTGPSGAQELDDEAVRAFRAAAPFVNPPEGLIGAKDGLITFAFSFFFDIGGGPRTSWHVIRP